MQSSNWRTQDGLYAFHLKVNFLSVSLQDIELMTFDTVPVWWCSWPVWLCCSKSDFPLFMLFFSRLSMSTFMYLVFSACPLSTSNLLKPGVFAEGSVLWNVNMRLCVTPEEPIFAGDKTPSYWAWVRRRSWRGQGWLGGCVIVVRGCQVRLIQQTPTPKLY